MARFRASPLVAGISGCVGGVEFAQGKTAGCVKIRRRSKRSQSPAQAAISVLAQSFNGWWDAATPALRQAWCTMAAAYPIKNRLGQTYQWTGKMYSSRVHQILFDCLGRPSLAAATLNYPPSRSIITPLFTSVTASFTAGGPYNITPTTAATDWTFSSLYATRTGNGAKGGATFSRYIGGKGFTNAAYNWYSVFTADGLDWDLQTGEHVLLTIRNMRVFPLYWPNYEWTIETVVAAP